MSDYPGGLDNFTDGIPNQPLNNPSLTNIVNDLNAAVRAIQQTLGLNPQAPESSVAAKLNAGIGLREIIVFESSGTFVKSDYPWLRAIRCYAQGAGGGGGRTNSSRNAGGGAGGGCGCSFVLEQNLLASETVTVGGSGLGATGLDSNGLIGGNSSFGAHAEGFGGEGTTSAGRNPLTGGNGSGDLVFNGGDGHPGSSLPLSGGGVPGNGGDSFFGKGGRGGNIVAPGSGRDGQGYGGGGGGASEDGSSGGDGVSGIVILELYG